MCRDVDGSVRDSTGGWKEVKENGVSAISIQDTAEELIRVCRMNGVFIVPVGVLESWLDISLGQQTWIATALEEISAGKYGDKGLDEFCARIDNYLSSEYKRISGENII